MVTAKLSIVVHISFERGCPLHRNSGGYYRTIVTLGPPQNKIESIQAKQMGCGEPRAPIPSGSYSSSCNAKSGINRPPFATAGPPINSVLAYRLVCSSEERVAAD